MPSVRRAARTLIIVVIFVGGGLCRGVASAAVDLTGDWDLTIAGLPGEWFIVQSGSALSASGSFGALSGTIDPDSGSFTLAGGFCPVNLTGTAAPDGNSFTASGTASVFYILICLEPSPISVEGTRTLCGNGVVDPGEECDDGFFTGDCCEVNCMQRADAFACEDGDPETHSSVCVAGTCTTVDAPEFLVNTTTSQSQENPAIACDRSGGFVVVWESLVSSTFSVLAQRYDSTGAPAGSELVVSAPASSIAQPKVAASASGDFVIAWKEPETAYTASLRGQRFFSDGTRTGTEFRINSNPNAIVNAPEIASDPAGNFIVVWDQLVESDNNLDVFGRRYSSAGAPLGTEFRVNAATAEYQANPAISIHRNGNFVVVWQDFSGAYLETDIRARRYASSGAPLGTEFQVNSNPSGFNQEPDVVHTGDGGFVVVWYTHLFRAQNARRYTSAGEPIGGQFRVSEQPSATAAHATLAAYRGGEFVVTWASAGDGSSYGISARQFDDNGAPIAGEFAVNGFTFNTQWTQDVCATPSGDFVMVWASDQQDGSEYGIFARHFPAPPLSGLDHYQCYQGRDLGDPEFMPLNVAISDQLGNESVELQKIKFVCVPVDKNGEGISDPQTSLTCYQARAPARSPVHVQVSSQFQLSRLELKKPKLLCLPSTTTLLP